LAGFAAGADVCWLRWGTSGTAGWCASTSEKAGHALVVGVIALSFAFYVGVCCTVVPSREVALQAGHT